MSLSQPLPNFDRAEFHDDPPPPDQCAYCHRGITAEYFRVNGNLACASCAQQAQSLVPPDSHKAYSRALLFGIGGAILGCIGYALVQILTGWTIGYAAVGVGYLVGKAMKSGSRGLGGRRYQITAALLTYAAVAISFVPVAMHEYSKKASQHVAVAAPQTAPVESKNATSGAFPVPGDAASQKAAPATPAVPAPAAKPAPSFGKFLLGIAMLLGIGLISPFLALASSPAGGLLGLFIIFIGISAAWRLTHQPRAEVDGPFEHSPAS
jgi:hypothetical protein